ncbi:MAG TPA: DUF6434 domain-containing protein [Oscillospiraceae bacterium]|nr:DUF6434 domain-containing protein [Oscillospiraceae bacterium]HPF55604.1 DUF6434 domain-containing protein [Clostridiales bacterium]HPK34617.1 DUF6434 domain-containing protein [Oscillospiraceae bacterium]HPR74618.1 DUF6434 domain-containing protein [Oscillospiraceae bacterium]
MPVRLTENTVIDESFISPDRYRAFFRKAIEGFSPEIYCGTFQYWLKQNNGKTIKEAIESYYLMKTPKIMEDRLKEERFHLISEADKSFILAFNREITELGYDFGGNIGWGACWGLYMIIYSKVGAKSKQVAARIFIRENRIILRLFFNNVDKHTQYIENAPEHIKSVFIGTHGDCSCNPKKENCRMRKTYILDGKTIEKCSGVVFEFHQPDLAKLPDYMGLLREFYEKKANAAI